MARILDTVVVQLTDLAHGGNPESRFVVQQMENASDPGNVVEAKSIMVNLSELTQEEQDAVALLKAAMQTKLDNA